MVVEFTKSRKIPRHSFEYFTPRLGQRLTETETALEQEVESVRGKRTKLAMSMEEVDEQTSRAEAAEAKLADASKQLQVMRNTHMPVCQ